jgi:hypothetical protein
MKFLLVMHLDPQLLDSLPAQDRDALFAGQDQFMKEITASGEMAGTIAVADPSRSVTVRMRDGAAVTADGPAVSAMPYVCGYYVVDCASKQRAIELAARIPDAKYTPVEVRPVVFDGTAEAS